MLMEGRKFGESSDNFRDLPVYPPLVSKLSPRISGGLVEHFSEGGEEYVFDQIAAADDSFAESDVTDDSCGGPGLKKLVFNKDSSDTNELSENSTASDSHSPEVSPGREGDVDHDDDVVVKVIHKKKPATGLGGMFMARSPKNKYAPSKADPGDDFLQNTN